MEIYIKNNDSYINIDTNLLEKIGDGYEGIVYSYNDMAIKVKTNFETTLSYDDAIKLKRIITNRILLPKNIVCYNKPQNKYTYIGYTTKLIDPIDKNKVIYMNPNTLYNEILLLNNDIKKLSNNKILISDISENDDNFIFNGHLYFVDPGSYIYDNNCSVNEVLKNNIRELEGGIFLNVIGFGYCLDSIYEELVNIMKIDKNYLTEKFLIYIRNIYYDYHYKRLENYEDSKQIDYLLKVLEKYGDLQKYKYSLLNEYLYNKNHNSTDDKILRKIIK